MKKIQITLEDALDRIEANHVCWLLAGNYETLKERPSVEEDLPKNVKDDLAIQRLLAVPNFRGIVANNPVVILRQFKGIFVNTAERFELE